MFVLHLRALPESVYYRAYLQDKWGEPLLSWFLHAFGQHDDLCILHHGGPDGAWLRGRPNAPGVTAFECREPTDLRALETAARNCADATIVMFSIECALAPCWLYVDLLRHHDQCGNHYTPVTGLPAGMRAEAFDREFALELASDPNAKDGLDPAALVARKMVGSLMNASGAAEVRAVPFQAFLRAAVLPERIVIETDEDVRDAVAVRDLTVGKLPSDDTVLRHWKRLVATRRGRKELAIRSAGPQRRGRPRLLFVSNSSALTGAETALAATAPYLAADYDLLGLIPYEGVFAERLSNAGVDVTITHTEIAQSTAANVELLSTVLAQLRPSVVHVNSYAGLPILAACSVASVPVVQHLRVNELEPYAEAIRNAHHIVAVSRQVRDQALRFDVLPERVHVIRDGIEMREFEAVEARAARADLALPENALVFAATSRISRVKRHDLMLTALAKVKQTDPNVFLVLAGEPTHEPGYAASIQWMVRTLGLEDNVRWLGFQRDTRPVVAACDAALLCSDHEGLGLAAAEAMAMRKPVILTTACGIAEIARDRDNALVIPPGDGGALAQAMAQLAGDPELRTSVARAGRTLVDEYLSAAATARRLSLLYRSIVDTW